MKKLSTRFEVSAFNFWVRNVRVDYIKQTEEIPKYQKIADSRFYSILVVWAAKNSVWAPYTNSIFQ
jgi:hypothetical protein